MNLTKEQQDIINGAKIDVSLSQEEILKIVQNEIDIDNLSDNKLVSFLEIANALYRDGNPILNDADYDFIFLAELRRRNPSHPFLQKVEPELGFEGKSVRLPVQMLSTDKAYTRKDIDRWCSKIIKAAKNVDVKQEELIIRITPKLDGYAAYDDGNRLYTRGDGRYGTDISRVFDRGLQIASNGIRGQGAGEIVVTSNYFDKYLSDCFENTRNFQASLIKEKELEPHAEKAIRDGAAVFFPFSQLPGWEGTLDDLEQSFETITNQVWGLVDYDVDGVILEVTNEEVKSHMGATRHHHRWQIAYKKNIEKAQVKVRFVKAQTARTGRVTPVVQLEPTRLSGVTISRATAHHYRMVQDKGIGPGALIELVRSGLVIPKIERVIEQAQPQIPANCPTCEASLVWDGDYLVCPNVQCSAQVENKLEHFFKTIRNVDGFGPKTIQRIYKHGITTVSRIYGLKTEDFIEMGFGDKTATNLMRQLLRSRSEPLEDWRLLAAFGVFRMGLGNCERLLQRYSLDDLFDLRIDDIIDIEGFAETTANVVVKGFRQIRHEFQKVYEMGFNLERTPMAKEEYKSDSPLSGKIVVFTGSMKSGKRSDMEKAAKKLGARIGSSVTGKTNFLVTGENVGSNKINTARVKGVKVLTEQEYLFILGTD